MPDKKISQLSAAATPLAGTEVLPIVQSSATVKVSADDLTAGRTVSAAKFSPTGTSATGNGMYLPAANTLGWSTNGSLKLSLDSSGNLGLGTTPQAWSTPALEVIGGAAVSTVAGVDYTLNAYYNAGWLYRSNGTATRYEQNTGQHRWYTAPSGVSGNAISFTQALTLTADSNLKIGGTADRATTAGTNHLDIFNGTAPVGTLANGISIYSSSGEAYVMDAAGNATLFSPHDAETNEWIFRSKHTPTGKVLKIDVERLLRFVNDHFGLDAVQEFVEP
jgi:hypothetical protein